MHYEECPPDPVLAGHIHCYWFLSAPRGRAVAQLQPIVPDGRMEMVLNLADAFLRHHRDGSVERQAVGLLAGQLTRGIVVEPSGAVDLVGIRFNPAGAGALLRVAGRELRDEVMDASLVPTSLASELADRLHTLHDTPSRVRALNAHMIGIRDRGKEPDPAVTAAVEGIHARRGRVRIDDVAVQLGMTRRTLERRFQAAVGIGPKLLARIARFQTPFREMQTSEPGTWGHVAHRCGYYDQAHLNQDFRAFTGASPTAFFAGHTTIADFFASGKDQHS